MLCEDGLHRILQSVHHIGWGGTQAERAADVNWDVHHGAPGQRPVGAPGLAGARGHGIHVEGAAAAASLVSKFAAPEEVRLRCRLAE